MFSYVAKSLASKTLRAFLGQYLENIELESIDYGSQSSSGDDSRGGAGGGGGGWGVSLSNVRLREGMVLMALPGKRKRKRKRKAGRRSGTQEASPGTRSPPASKSAEKTTREEAREELRVGRPRANCEEATASERIAYASYKSCDEEESKEKLQSRHHLASVDSDNGYLSSGPSTPIQRRDGICGMPSTFCLNGNSSRPVESPQKSMTGDLSVPVPFYEAVKNNGKDTEHPIGQVGTPPASTGECSEQQFSADHDDGNARAEVEEESIVEDDLELVVGAGGVIGTLNIRMIEKELHISVEDAHLIVEAVTRESNSDNDDAGKPKNKETLNTSTSNGAVPSADGREDSTTMGSKIKQTSPLARYLSMIPHLFLRDCRVSLILPETDDVADDETSTAHCTVFEAGIDFLSATEWREPSRDDGVSRKRISTGKGPDGGLWLKVYPPQDAMPRRPRVRLPTEPRWARARYLDSSESFCFRASGIDVQARLLTPTNAAADDGADRPDRKWSEECEEYTLDSMLFGVDYVDPISLTRIYSSSSATRQVKHPTQENSRKDASDSTFDWTALKEHYSDCVNGPLPPRDCFHCWNAYVNQTRATPEPGFVFSLSITDPIEVNVDRSSLEAFGYLASLLTSQKSQIKKNTKTTRRNPCENDEVAPKLVLDDDASPPSLQPDAIHLSSVSVDCITIRIEVIQPRPDSDLKFRFWQFAGQSIHFDVFQVNHEKQLLDVTCHVGSVKCTDFTGVCNTDVLVAGVEPHVNDSEILIPCTARHVLGLPSPIATDKHCNTSYAVNIRVVRVDGPKKEVVGDANFAHVNLRTGIFDIDAGASLIRDFSKAFNEALAIFPIEKQSNVKTSKRPDHKSILPIGCQVSTKGGTISYRPIIQMNIPVTVVRVSNGVEGFSCDTVLEKLGIKYGSYTFERPPTPSILSLYSLPENLRINILLYLDDISPLEKVFNIRTSNGASSFLRSHAINKKLTYLSTWDTPSTKERARCESDDKRRSTVMSQLQALDVDSLEALLAMHNRGYREKVVAVEASF